MPVLVSYRVRCDNCGGGFDPGRPLLGLRYAVEFAYSAEAIRAATKRGWALNGQGGILCPPCREGEGNAEAAAEG